MKEKQNYLGNIQNLLDKEIYETLGFQNGLNPQTDLRAVGMLGPIMIINFINRIQRIYRHASIDKELENFFFKNMLQVSQNSTEHVFDGYPLVLVMFHMVHICASLIDGKLPRQNKKLISQKRATLEMICKRYFGNNVYLALNEVFFHMLSIFIISWRFGFAYFAA